MHSENKPEIEELFTSGHEIYESGCTQSTEYWRIPHFLLFHIAFRKIWLTTVWGSHTTLLIYILIISKASSCSGRVLTERESLFVYKWVVIFQVLLTREITFLHVLPYYLQGAVQGLSVSFDSCLTNTEDQVLP